ALVRRDPRGQAGRRAGIDQIAPRRGDEAVPESGADGDGLRSRRRTDRQGPPRLPGPRPVGAISRSGTARSRLSNSNQESPAMPQWGNQDYKAAVFQQLAQGSGGDDQDHFQHFENFSAGAPRRDVEQGVGEAFHPERLSSEEIEPQFRAAAQKMQPQE